MAHREILRDKTISVCQPSLSVFVLLYFDSYIISREII